MLRSRMRTATGAPGKTSFAALAATLVLCSLLGAPAAAQGAATPTCTSVSIAKLDAALGIDAAKVNSVRPSRPAGALICSYYGLSGRAANEATINYLPASALAFAGVEKSFSNQYAVSSVAGIKTAAYEYDLKGE